MRAGRPRRRPLHLPTTPDERTNLPATAGACRRLPDHHRHPRLRHRRPPTSRNGLAAASRHDLRGNFDAASFAILDAEEQRAFRLLFNQGRLRIEQERVLFVYANEEIREPEIVGPSIHKRPSPSGSHDEGRAANFAYDLRPLRLQIIPNQHNHSQFNNRQLRKKNQNEMEVPEKSCWGRLLLDYSESVPGSFRSFLCADLVT